MVRRPDVELTDAHRVQVVAEIIATCDEGPKPRLIYVALQEYERAARARLAAATVAAVAFVTACGAPVGDDSNGAEATGGAFVAATGGELLGTGGAYASTGGVAPSGGTSTGGASTGGEASTGGTPSTGGVEATGGTDATGGTSTGGASTGGASTGGAQGTGGAASCPVACAAHVTFAWSSSSGEQTGKAGARACVECPAGSHWTGSTSASVMGCDATTECSLTTPTTSSACAEGPSCAAYPGAATGSCEMFFRCEADDWCVPLAQPCAP